MIKLITLIILIILLFYILHIIQEKFIVNPESHMKHSLELDNYFRRCLQKYGFYYCIKNNPYRKVIPYKIQIPKQKKVWYLKYKKVNNLLPVNLN